MTNKAEKKVHAMVTIDHTLYILDGDELLKMEVPYETLWQKIGKFLGIIK